MVSLSLAKQHLEYESDDRDALIAQYLGAATAWVENYTGKKMSDDAVVENLEGFASPIVLAKGPFISLTSIAYVDSDNAPATVTGARVLNGAIYPPETGWPSKADYTPVTVTYQAGYTVVPADLDSAILLLVGHYFANREAVVTGAMPSELQLAVESLCRPYRDVLV